MISTSTHKNLKLLVWLRTFAIAGQSVAILVVTKALNIPLPTGPLWFILAGLVVANLLTLFRIRTAPHISNGEFFAQLLLDISALAAVLYFTGGAQNPFAPLFIMHVMIAAIALPPLYTWLIAAITAALYTTLMFFKIEVPYFLHHHIGDFFSLHVQGMWMSFILLSTIVAWFIVRMNNVLRKQAEFIAEAEKIAAIGTLAANAAHELGTPLATITLLAEDCGKNAEALTEQAKRCKEIISRITALGGVTRAEAGNATSLENFLKKLVTEWREKNQSHNFKVELKGSGSPQIVAESGLIEGICNLLDNAAHSSKEVSFTASWNSQKLKIIITDKGEGINKEILPKLGEMGVTTKPDGMGMGIFLARNIITRLDGSLEFKNNPYGASAIIELPLKRLSI